MKNHILIACLLSCFAGQHIGVEAQDQSGSQNPESEINWNNIVDFILVSLRQEIITTGQEHFPIPDIYEPFAQRLVFFTMTGNFQAWNGYFRNLASLQRIGDVAISQNDHKYTLSCALGFGEASAHYGNYRLMVRNGGSVSGSMSVSVGRNSVALTVEVELKDNGEFKATLKKLRIVRMDDMRLRLTGFGFLNELAGDIATGAIQRNEGLLIEKIENALTPVMENTLKNMKLDF